MAKTIQGGPFFGAVHPTLVCNTAHVQVAHCRAVFGTLAGCFLAVLLHLLASPSHRGTKFEASCLDQRQVHVKGQITIACKRLHNKRTGVKRSRNPRKSITVAN